MDDRVIRQAAYDLLARLYLGEPDAALVDRMRTLPGFTELLPDDDSLEAWLEEEAAEYQWLFGMNVYPYESIFVGHDLMLNGEGSERIAALYAHAGFDPDRYKMGAPDHFGIELTLMRNLIWAERFAAGTDDSVEKYRAQALQVRCLNEHLAIWTSIFALTVQRIARRPLHRLLAELTIEMVLGDVERCALNFERGDKKSESRNQSSMVQRSTSNAQQDEEGINSTVHTLITPARVGVFITRADIGRLADELQLPVAIGDRFVMLRSLFMSAAQFDLLPGLLDALGRTFDQAEQSYAQLAAYYPVWSGHAKHWQRVISNGKALLSKLRTEAIS